VKRRWKVLLGVGAAFVALAAEPILYVELGFPKDAKIDADAWKQKVLADLKAEGVITDHQLIADHSVVMDPAYVHITQASIDDVARRKADLAAHGVHSIGRYGGWTYCSIEDNIVEARALAKALSQRS
jgi:hypothetical protein